MRRSRIVLGLVVAVLVAAGVSVGVRVAADRRGSPARQAAVAPAPSPVLAQIPVDGKPRQLVLDADGLWALTDRGLQRIDPSADRVESSTPLGIPTAYLGGLALSADAVWVPGVRSDLLWRVDRAANRVSGQVRLGQVLHGPVGVAAYGDSVWVTCCALEYGAPAGMLLRVDARRGRVTARVPVPEGPMAVVADRDAVWVGTARGSLLRVDPVAAKVVGRVPPPDRRGRVQALSRGPGVLWVADTGAGAIRRFDLTAGRFDVGVTAPAPRNLAAGTGPDEAWVVTDLNQLLSRVDAGSGRRGPPVPVQYLGGVRGVAVGAGAVWVTTGDQVVRLDPSRVARPSSG